MVYRKYFYSIGIVEFLGSLSVVFFDVIDRIVFVNVNIYVS